MLDDSHPNSSTCEEIEECFEFPPSILPGNKAGAEGLAAVDLSASLPAVAKKMPNILIVDDNPGDVELIRIAFEMAGIAVHSESAADGLVAARLLSAAATAGTLPDLVLLDLNMPRVNGLEVLSMLRRSGLLDRVPVVVLSTSEQALDRRRCLEQGAREFQTKPEHIRDLIRMVQGFRRYLDPAVDPAI